MNFDSILFGIEQKNNLNFEQPDFFIDLNLDQIIDAIILGRQEYGLKPFFYTSLNDLTIIKYRQEIFKDLENISLLESIKSFSEKISTMHRYLNLAEKLYNKYHKEGWFLEAVETYCEAINGLLNDLSFFNLKSQGLISFRNYLDSYANSVSFKMLLAETNKLKQDLSNIKYCIIIKENWIRVKKYENEIDYSTVIEETFKKFQVGAVKDYRVKLHFSTGISHVEAKILELVAKLYPAIFLSLDNYCKKNSNFLDEKIKNFNKEIQFYISYLEYIKIFKKTGLNFCFPQISKTSKEIYNYEGFDLALAYKLIHENTQIVCNDFYLKDKERILVITGPNQGGKTTFARTFGQLHYLGSLGCPIPGRKAKLFIPDRIFTHFEKEESIKTLRGKLEDELVRIYDILGKATQNSIIILNEIFTSTTLKDAIFLSKKIMERIIQLDLLCVCVTFIDELAFLSEKTVSMVSTVFPENPTLRTYKILRKPADGLAYAISIAEKYRLTYEFIRERIKS